MPASDFTLMTAFPPAAPLGLKTALPREAVAVFSALLVEANSVTVSLPESESPELFVRLTVTLPLVVPPTTTDAGSVEVPMLGVSDPLGLPPMVKVCEFVDKPINRFHSQLASMKIIIFIIFT